MAFGFDPSTALRTRHPSVAGANSDSARRNLPVHLSLSSCRVSEIVLKQGYHGVPLITWLSHAFSLERRKTTWMPGIKDRGSTTPSSKGLSETGQTSRFSVFPGPALRASHEKQGCQGSRYFAGRTWDWSTVWFRVIGLDTVACNAVNLVRNLNLEHFSMEQLCTYYRYLDVFGMWVDCDLSHQSSKHRTWQCQSFCSELLAEPKLLKAGGPLWP